MKNPQFRSLYVNIFAAAAVVASVAPTLFGQERWISLTTPHFEMYTTNAESQALQELQFLEGVRSFLVQVSPPQNPHAEEAVQLVAFRSASEYAPYAFRTAGGAYYLRKFNREYIVLPDVSSRNRELVVHEYTHVVVERSGLKLPVWLNEGLAEFYSSAEPRGQQVIVGDAKPQHLATLARHAWMPWSALFAVDRNSPDYNEGQKLTMFYAQSWALTHMLASGAEYAPHFKQFLTAVSAGQTSDQALQSIYGKNIATIQADLETYLHRRPLPVEAFDITWNKEAIQPQLAQPSDFQIRFALAVLLTAKPATLDRSKGDLAAISHQYPTQPEPEECLGALALEEGHTEDAKAHLDLAIGRQSKNPESIYQYAVLRQNSGAKDQEVLVLLRRAVALRPSFKEANLELGLLEAQDSEYEPALAILEHLPAIAPADEFDVYIAMARCNLHLDHSAAAKSYATKASRAAKGEDQKQEAREMLAELEVVAEKPAAEQDQTPSAEARVEPRLVQAEISPLTNVQGATKALDCTSGAKRLHVQVERREMIFDLTDPSMVVRNATPSFSHWTCGALKAEQLTVVYAPSNGTNNSTADPAITGTARELVFFPVAANSNIRRSLR